MLNSEKALLVLFIMTFTNLVNFLEYRFSNLQVYGAISIVSGLGAIWSLTVLTLERALVIGRAGYGGAGKVTNTGLGMFYKSLGHGLAVLALVSLLDLSQLCRPSCGWWLASSGAVQWLPASRLWSAGTDTSTRSFITTKKQCMLGSHYS